MANWRNFYLQEIGSSTQQAYESVETWGVWCKDIPFKLYDKVKEPAKRSWPDEHGDDEYIPAGGLFIEAYTMKVEFGCKVMNQIPDGETTIDGVSDVREKVGAFISYIRSSGMMMMYSSHTRIGRKDVRLDTISDNAKWVSIEGQEFLVFEVTFKVNDPVTDVILRDGSLIIDDGGSSTSS